MKNLATVLALTAFAATAFAQSSTVTPQSAADTQREKAAVAKTTKTEPTKAAKPAAPKSKPKAATTAQ